MSMYPANDWNKETDTAIYFYTPEFYALDNFSAFRVKIWDKDFQTSEHAYQWKKFSTALPEIAERIFFSPSPNEAKSIADVAGLIDGWHDIRISVMEEILRAKLAQHAKVKKTLLATGNRDIIENSPTDTFWGIGEKGDGQNQLGKMWMRLRAELVAADS